jgi:hypothetical protein
LAKNDLEYRKPIKREQFKDDFTEAFNQELYKKCYSDPIIHVAREARNAIVHNGCKLTKQLHEIKHPFIISNNEIHIIAEHTNTLFNILKLRASMLIIAAREHRNIILNDSGTA